MECVKRVGARSASSRAVADRQRALSWAGTGAVSTSQRRHPLDRAPLARLPETVSHGKIRRTAQAVGATCAKETARDRHVALNGGHTWFGHRGGHPGAPAG